MKKIESKDRVDPETIKTFEQIDGYDVMRELFIFKGEDRVCRDMRVDFKLLVEAALVVYDLKYSSNNKLYVSFYLNRFYKKEGLITPNGSIKVPVSIYDECKAINDQYR